MHYKYYFLCCIKIFLTFSHLINISKNNPYRCKNTCSKVFLVYSISDLYLSFAFNIGVVNFTFSVHCSLRVSRYSFQMRDSSFFHEGQVLQDDSDFTRCERSSSQYWVTCNKEDDIAALFIVSIRNKL